MINTDFYTTIQNNDNRYLTNMAKKAFEKGNTNDAFRYISRVIEKYNYCSIKPPKEIKTLYVEIYNAYIPYYVSKIKKLFEEGDLERAMLELEHIIDLYRKVDLYRTSDESLPKSVELLKTEIYEAVAKDDAKKAENAFKKGDIKNAFQNIESTEYLYREINKKLPESIEMLKNEIYEAVAKDEGITSKKAFERGEYSEANGWVEAAISAYRAIGKKPPERIENLQHRIIKALNQQKINE